MTQPQAKPAARQLPAAASGWRWLPVTLLVIVLDQLSKVWIVQHFVPFERMPVLRVLDIVLTYNTGAAFSLLAEASGWQRWLFALLALAVSATLLVWLRRLSAAVHGGLACALSLIIGGALGNMLDRLTNGRVIDFIYFHWRQHYFPAFNVADSAITLGAAVLLIDAWREGRAQRQGRG
jgi:signal peptidase II